jgi:hypothetical protein
VGAERNVHFHDALDGFWFVLSGKARSSDVDDHVIAEPSAHKGVFIPRDVPSAKCSLLRPKPTHTS